MNLPSALPWAGQVDLGRDEARRAAARELSRLQYQQARPPLLYRLLGRAVRFVLRELLRASAHVPGGRAGLLLLAGLAVLVTAGVVYRLGPLRGRTSRRPVLAPGPVQTAAQYRAAAEAAAAAGQYAEAIRDLLRAVVRELEVSGVLDPRPGRTADEVAAEAGAAVPGWSAPLSAAARVFDDVWYGSRTADASGYAVVAAADRAVRPAAAAVR